MKKYLILVVVLFLNTTYSQVVVCFGTTKAYSVDTLAPDGPNGTSSSTYVWQVKNSGGTVISTATITNTTTSGNGISINWGTTPVGSYILEVVETNNSCTAGAVTLQVNIKARPSVAAPNTAVCLAANGTILATTSPSDSGDVYSWTAPAGYAGTINTNTLTITGATVAMGGNYTVKVTDSEGCESDPVTAVLTVNSLPSATITPTTATEFCDGGSVVLSAPTGLSYVWNKDGVAILPSQTAVSFTASLEGSYTVTTTDSNSCSSTTNPAISVVVNPNPTVTVAATATQFCNGSNATLTATPAAGTAPFNYQWENTSGNITTSGTNASYMATTTSDYKVTVTDNKGCFVTSVAQTISNRPNPDASITPLTSTTFCAGASVVLQRGGGALVNHTYQWIKDAVDIATASTNFNYTATESGSYKVRVIDANYTTNCTTTTPDLGAVIVTKTNSPLTTTITAH